MQTLGNELSEVERKVKELEQQLQRAKKENWGELEKQRQSLMSVIQSKADFKDMDQLQLKIHAKADADKVKAIHSEIRQELLSSLTTFKKDLQTRVTRKEEEVTAVKVDIDSFKAKSEQDQKSLLEKLHRLASQFDKELMSRDKQIKQLRNLT